MKAGTGVMLRPAEKAQGHWKLGEARKDSRRVPSPANTLSSAFWPPGPGESTFVSTAVSHQSCGSLLQQPQKTDTVPKAELRPETLSAVSPTLCEQG